MLNFQLSVAVLIVVCSVWVATAIPWFQMMIPNGEKVPNPCTLETSDIWERVGHKIRDKDNDTELIKNRFGEVSIKLFYSFILVFICLLLTVKSLSVGIYSCYDLKKSYYDGVHDIKTHKHDKTPLISKHIIHTEDFF